MKTIIFFVCLTFIVPALALAKEGLAPGTKLLKSEQIGDYKLELVERNGKQYARIYFPLPKTADSGWRLREEAAKAALRDFVIRIKKEPMIKEVNGIKTTCYSGIIRNSRIYRARDYLVLSLEGVIVE